MDETVPTEDGSGAVARNYTAFNGEYCLTAKYKPGGHGTDADAQVHFNTKTNYYPVLMPAPRMRVAANWMQ